MLSKTSLLKIKGLLTQVPKNREEHFHIMEITVPRYFKPDGKPGRPKKKDRENKAAPFDYPGRDYLLPKESKRKILLQLSKDHYTPEQWLGLLSEYKNQCLRCGKQNGLAADHIVPAILGGSDGIENIQPLCKSCNSSKGIRTIDYRPGFAFEVI